jgi:hypothetical protein
MSNVIDWPSKPDKDGRVPPLIELLSAPEPLAGHVMLLMNKAAELAKTLNGKPDGFQIPVQTPFGLVSVPGVIKLADNTLILLYSHKGEWTDLDVDRLMRWTVALRANPQTMNLRIEVLSDLPALPKTVLETVDNQIHTIAGLCGLILVDPMKPEESAPQVLNTLSHVLGKQLDFDRASLQAVDAFVQTKFPPIAEDWTYRSASVALFGLYLGICIALERGGEWADASAPFPAWMKQIQIGKHTLNPMGRASKFLRDPKKDPLTELFDLSTPEVMARTEAAVNQKLEGQNNA